MPSPVGHVLGGLAVGAFLARDRDWRLPVACGFAAALPDIDFLLPIAHRGPTHSVAAGLVVIAVTWVFPSGREGAARLRLAAALGLAVLSHVLLDWLGQDSSNPRGVMALWPLTSAYYVSDLNLFNAVDRRYWLEGFWRRNVIAVFWEIVILVPIVLLASTRRRFNTRRSRGRSSVRGAQRPPSS